MDEYFPGSDYQPADEYEPSNANDFLWSKRIVGPIQPDLIGDTVTLYMSMDWDCGDKSEARDDLLVSVIIE